MTNFHLLYSFDLWDRNLPIFQYSPFQYTSLLQICTQKMRTLFLVRETLKSKKYNTNTIVVHYFLTIVPPLDSRVGWWTANKKTFHFNPTLAFEQSKASLIFAKLYNYIAKASGVQIRWFFAHLTVIRYQQMQICRFFLFIIF